ncbi:MAG: type II toxin-antitoxin system RelE/ParE family toxin [Acidobacteria bacterium]|nr:type II toxin-antitoxin system RelE/ParE family toxin [Acidobacteriota bacterium]
MVTVDGSPSPARTARHAGKPTGQYSIRVNDQWRICFGWREGNAYNVEIVDYH